MINKEYMEESEPMKAELIKPSSGLKIYKVDVNKLEERRQEKGNSFSISPQEGEKWTQYSFRKEIDEKVAEVT